MVPVRSAVVPLRSPWRITQLVAGALIPLGGSVLLVVAALGSPSVAPAVVALVVAALLAVLGVAILAGGVVGFAARALVVDADGIRWDSTRHPWTMPWSELSQAAMHVGYQRSVRRGVLGRRRRRIWRVHLELVLADPGSAALHPGMAHLQGAFVGGGPDRYAIPFAQRRELVPPVDEALRTFGGQRYRPVVDDGEIAWGRGYRRR